MKLSAKSCFCMLLPFLVLFEAETLGRRRGVFIPECIKKLYPSHFSRDIPILSPTPSRKPSNVQFSTLLTFTQILDHFNCKDTRTFLQRYYVYNEKNHEAGRPVYLVVGGLSEVKSTDIESGIWNLFAKESNAIIFELEHRYYGKSYDFDTMGYATEKLEYLNTEQALLDLVFFINMIKRYYPSTVSPKSKWVALGLSYGGMLAAQLRLKYPQHIDAAVAWGAPLMPTVEFKDFYQIVANQLAKNKKVAETIKEVYVMINTVFFDNEKFDDLKTNLNILCDVRLDRTYNYMNMTFLYWSLSTLLSIVLQYENAKQLALKTKVMEIIANDSTGLNAFQRFENATKEVLAHYNIPCIQFNYRDLLNEYLQKSPHSECKFSYLVTTGLGNRLNLYQQCTQWGHFETANEPDGLFASIPVEFYVKLCKDVFGDQYDKQNLIEAVDETTVFYGGRDIKVKNVLFIDNSHDFYTNLSFQNKTSRYEEGDESVTVYLEEKDPFQGGKCDEELIDNWNYILRKLKKWSGIGSNEEDAVEQNANNGSN